MPNVTNDDAYAEILSLLRALKKNGDEQPSPISLIDPTANVLKHVEGAVKRLDDLVASTDKWSERVRRMEREHEVGLAALRDQLREAEAKRLDAERAAEARRLDSVNAETKAAVALATERATTTASTLATNLATTTLAQNDRMSRLEQQMYQSGGRDVERGVQKGQSNVDRALLVSLTVAVIGMALTIVLFVLRR